MAAVFRLIPVLAFVVAIGALCTSAIADSGAEKIHWPMAGRPAIVVPGGTFGLGLPAMGAVRLAGSGREYALDVASEQPQRGIVSTLASVPEDAAPGMYTLRLTQDGNEFIRDGAVHVVPAVQEEYSFAFLRGLAFAEGGEEGPQAALRARLLESGVALAFLIGPLLEEGAPANYQQLQRDLEALPLPVFVCPSPRDARSPAYQAVFGSPVYGTGYGVDGFLMLGPGLAGSDTTSVQALGPAYRARRELRPSRWSTGVTSMYGLDWHPRAQMVLFADDPLDYLLAGTVPEGIGNTVPFGPARLLPPPAIPRGSLLIFDVSNNGIRLRQETQTSE